MSHSLHSKLPGFDRANVLHDGCPECEHRAQDPLEGLLKLDRQNIDQLWQDMRDIKWSGGKGPTRNYSECDLKLIQTLYLIGVLAERTLGLDPVSLNTRAIIHVESTKLG